MKDKLLEYIWQFDQFSDEEKNDIADTIEVKTYTKGTVLVEEGSTSNSCYFVLGGCLRQFMIVDGDDNTTAFYTEEHGSVFFTNNSEKTPSRHYLECVEDTSVTISTPEKEARMFSKYPKLESLARIITEGKFLKSQEQFTNFMISSPEERYQNLLRERPDLFQRVPQHQLASYLGIKPQSLSRIRKRIISK